MTAFLSRDVWTQHPPVRALTPFAAGEVLGVAVHYTGSARPLTDDPTVAQSCALLEAERRLHVTAPRSWSDIAYNAAIDKAGRVFNLRGIEHRSAANGDERVNRAWAAVTFLVGVGEGPTPVQVEAFTAWRRLWLRRWPAATRVVGHRDLHSTECPGAPLYALVTAGRLSPGPPPQEDHLALSEEDLDRVADRVADRLLAAPGGKAPRPAKYVARDGDELLPITDALTRLLDRTRGQG